MQVAILQEEDGAITWARGQGGNLAGAGNLVRVGQAGGWVGKTGNLEEAPGQDTTCKI